MNSSPKTIPSPTEFDMLMNGRNMTPSIPLEYQFYWKLFRLRMRGLLVTALPQPKMLYNLGINIMTTMNDTEGREFKTLGMRKKAFEEFDWTRLKSIYSVERSNGLYAEFDVYFVRGVLK